MCTVSAILNYGMGQATTYWTPDNWPHYQELLRKAAEYDRITGQPDCHDPAKAEWLKKIEERLAAIEHKLETAGGHDQGSGI